MTSRTLGRFLPHPLLSATLTVVWILLANDFSAGNLLLGAAIGIGVAKFSSAYWPGQSRVRHPLLIAEYFGIVLHDIIVSNVQIAGLVLFRPGTSLRSRMVTVPLDLRSPEGIVVLAGTITMTPGTLTAEVSPDGASLAVHCLDAADEATVVAEIKNRYEQRLLRIFQ
jgi:multicomponent K+:H+ antiporter subunit E